jgi:alkanesulfonate monooxygenase SsuD/methylene tetrahydromethanopterin reductase-like flavin-dependent oxidoreductase (luciferase family)
VTGFAPRLGLHSGQQFAGFTELLGLWTTAERAGFDWVSLFDHVRPPLGGDDGPCLEAMTSLAALSAVTSRIRCALMVAAPAWRHPALLAAGATTIDHVSNGRLELGLGVGGGDLAYDQFGITRPPATERYDYFDEYCAVVSGLLRDPSFTFEGRYFSSAGRLAPRPLQAAVPLTIGASGERQGLRLAAKWADTWNTLVVPVPEYANKCRVLDDWCAKLGRDPSRIRRSITFRTVLSTTPERTRAKRDEYRARLGGTHPDLHEHLDVESPAQLVDVLGNYRNLGASDFLLGLRPPIDQETLEIFATDVIPQLR